MSNNNTEIDRDLGEIGNYRVKTRFVNKRSFPTVKRWNGNGYETQRMMVSQTKKSVVLTDKHGDTVEFSAYIHRGQVNYRDSREKNPIADHEAHDELKRMLGINDEYAKRLLSVTSMSDKGE